MGDASARPVISEKAHAECVRLLDLLINKRVQESWSWVFMAPVVGIPGYHDIIKKPMDLGTVKKNLGSKPSRCRFKSHEKFAKDVRLVFQNALVYNKEDEQVKGSVFDAAQHLLRVFENAYAKAKETVFSDEDDAADHNSSTNEEQDATVTVSANGDAAEKEKEKSRHHSRSSSSATASHSHSHNHTHSSSEHESSSKHKKDKSSKKEKKSKKSKKKSKDKDKDRERDKTKERSSSKEKEKDRDRDKDKDRERKSSAAGTDEAHKKSHVASGSSSSAVSGDKTVSSSTHSRDRQASATKATEAASAGAGSSEVARTSKTAVPSSSSQSSSSSSKLAPSGSSNGAAASTPIKMSEETMNACLAVLMKLIKYKEGNVSPAAPFLQPVDLMHFPDYKIKVPNRMHLYGVQKKLRSGGYATMDTFAYDVRLVFSNCLVYNSDVVLSKVIRSHAVTLIKLFEAQFAKIGGAWPGIPDRWKCHQIIHDILADRTDGLETAQWFKYPIETYFDSADQVPYGYFKKIKHPMDLGTVSSKLHLGVYRHAPELLQDLKLIFDNCVEYWSSDPHGMAYCESAKKLLNALKIQSSTVLGTHVVEKAMTKDKSSKSSSSSSSAGAHPSATTSATKDRKSSSGSGSGAGHGASSSAPTEEERSRKRSAKHMSSNFPQKEVCMEIVKALRQHKMKGYQDIEILTAGPFMHAVDVTKYPDYLKVVSEPMDFAKIERKLKGDRYSDVNEFSADVHLIFSNCHKYNSDPIEGADIRAMASNLRDYFVDLYNEKFGDGGKPVRSNTSTAVMATLPSAKLEASRAERAPVRAVSSSVPKKTPVASATKQPAIATAPSTTSTTKNPPSGATKVIADAKTGNASAGVSSAVNSSAARLSSTSTSGQSGSKSSTSQMTPQELEDYKKRKKEKKEKKEKKDKKKKDKKEKKKKDKDRKDRKEKDKSAHSRVERDGQPSSSSTARAGASSLAGAAVASTKHSSAALAPPAAVVASHPARPSPVASKISPAESSTSTSKSKTKKSKKSELTGWEAIAERVLNRVVKIEQVTKLHFDKPLLEVFPELAQDYRRLVHEPMDLRTLREKLHTHSLASPGDFTRLGRVIFQNAIRFNCAPDPASAHVRDMSAHLLWYFESLCFELKLGGSSTDAAKLDTLRRDRATVVNNTPMEVKARECQKLLRVLGSQKYDKNCWPFRKPVQVLFPTLPPEYYEIIKTPMDLATVGEKLAAAEYKVHGEFIRDVRLTFENAIRYNHADKDREGWNVYSAATQMLVVVEDQWCDVTLEVMERVRRREIVRKERDRLGEKRKGEKRHDGDDRKAVLVAHVRPPSTSADAGISNKAKALVSSSENSDLSAIAKASVVIAPPSSKDDSESSTKLRLQIVNRPNLDRMNKSERKAEEKRRKRARREEEIARSEKRRRTAVAATDDALREAELRSRRRIQKLEIAEAVKQREERERQQRDDAAAKSLAMRMKFNAGSWTGQLASGQGFWLRKPAKLQVPSVFGAAVDSY